MTNCSTSRTVIEKGSSVVKSVDAIPGASIPVKRIKPV
jgi:hypothetical protein